MKWFKHDSDAFFSEGIDALIESEGFAGYGRWNRLLEIVAFKMDESNRCHVEFSIKKWCSLLGLKQKKLISFLELTENKLKTKVVYSENIIKIEIPNLLKKRDNYTNNLQVTSKPLTTKIKNKIKNNKKPNIGRFNDLWKKYPNKDGKKAAEKHFNATVKTEEDWININKALDKYLSHLKVETWKKPKNGSTWFNNWQDWVDFEVEEPKDYEVSIDGESVFLTETEFKTQYPERWEIINARQ